MKIASYIDEGSEQLILTPENEQEKKMLEIFGNEKENNGGNIDTPLSRPKSLRYYRGEFYRCAGGWQRESTGKESLIIVFDNVLKKKV